MSEQSNRQQIDQVEQQLKNAGTPPPATLCSELCNLTTTALENEWWDNWEAGCAAHQQYCQAYYGACPACLLGAMVAKVPAGRQRSVAAVLAGTLARHLACQCGP